MYFFVRGICTKSGQRDVMYLCDRVMKSGQ